MKAKVSRFVLPTSFMQMSYELCFVYSAAMKVTTGMNCANVGSETTSTAWMCVKYELADGIFEVLKLDDEHGVVVGHDVQDVTSSTRTGCSAGRPLSGATACGFKKCWTMCWSEFWWRHTDACRAQCVG